LHQGEDRLEKKVVKGRENGRKEKEREREDQKSGAFASS